MSDAKEPVENVSETKPTSSPELSPEGRQRIMQGAGGETYNTEPNDPPQPEPKAEQPKPETPPSPPNEWQPRQTATTEAGVAEKIETGPEKPEKEYFSGGIERGG